MKKRMLCLAAVLTLMLSLSIPMASARWAVGAPKLTIRGTTATCFADYQSTGTTDDVVLNLSLWQGNTKIDSWAKHGTGEVIISETCQVETGKTYKLTMTPVVNGSIQESVSVTAKS